MQNSLSEINDTSKGPLMALVAQGALERYIENPKSYYIDTRELNDDEDIIHIGKGADKIETKCLILENCENPPQLNSIEFYYNNNRRNENNESKIQLIESFPKWLIDYFLIKYGYEWKTIDNKKILNIDFFRIFYPNTAIKIHTSLSDDDQKDQKMFLTSKCSYLDQEERREFLSLIPHSQYQTQVWEVNDINKTTIKCGFHLRSAGLIIHHERADQIKDIKIRINGKYFLHYNSTLIELFTKKYQKYIEIFYNHENDANFVGGINHNRIDNFQIEIEWNRKVNGNIYIASKTMNITNITKDGSILRYSVPNLGKIGNPWKSYFSLYRIPNNRVGYIGKEAYIEGYWWDGNYKCLDHPIPEPAENPVEQEYIDILRKIFDCVDTNSHIVRPFGIIEGLQVVRDSYLGFSNCRICNKMNGSTEYTITNGDDVIFRVPEGFIHYLEEHNIHPSDKFKEFISQSFKKGWVPLEDDKNSLKNIQLE